MTDHLGFIVAAYGITAVTLCATIAGLLLDLRHQKRLVRRFAPKDEGA